MIFYQVVSLEIYTSKDFIKKRERPKGLLKNGWIQTPQKILKVPWIKQALVLSKRFWIIPWQLAYHRLVYNLVGDVKANPWDFYGYISSQKKDNKWILPLKRTEVEELALQVLKLNMLRNVMVSLRMGSMGGPIS